MTQTSAAAIWWIDTKFCADIHDGQRMNQNHSYSGYPLSSNDFIKGLLNGLPWSADMHFGHPDLSLSSTIKSKIPDLLWPNTSKMNDYVAVCYTNNIVQYLAACFQFKTKWKGPIRRPSLLCIRNDLHPSIHNTPEKANRPFICARYVLDSDNRKHCLVRIYISYKRQRAKAVLEQRSEILGKLHLCCFSTSECWHQVKGTMFLKNS